MDLFNSLKKSANDDFIDGKYEEAVQKYTLLLKNKNVHLFLNLRTYYINISQFFPKFILFLEPYLYF